MNKINLYPGIPADFYLHLAGELLHPVLTGLLLASIFAAIMSTADSQLLVAASSLVRDIYQKLVMGDREIPERFLTLLSRLMYELIPGFFLALAMTVIVSLLSGETR